MVDTHLHHRDVPVKHSERQRGPVPAVGVDGGVSGRVAWNLENTTKEPFFFRWASATPGQVTQAPEQGGASAGRVTRSPFECLLLP